VSTPAQPARARSGRPPRWAVAGAAGAAAAAAAAYAANRALARRRAGPGPAAADPDLGLPDDVVHRHVTMRDGCQIHVVERGEGPVIVLLHGAGLAASVWAYQFRDLTPSHHLVAIDLRGHGESEPGADRVTTAGMADDLAEVLEQLDLHHVILVGHSMGGMTILRFARRHRALLAGRVGAILLMSTAGGVLPNAGPWTTLGPVAARTAVGVEALVNRSGRLWIPRGPMGWLASRVGFGSAAALPQVEATLELLRSTRPSHLVGLFPEIMGFDEREPYVDLAVPVTVLVGDRDRLTPPGLARELAAAIPGARLLVWPGGGHMLMYERREALDWLLETLARSTRPDGSRR
jgi:pimeloyl-ACP methyl ester carboxylesterase